MKEIKKLYSVTYCGNEIDQIKANNREEAIDNIVQLIFFDAVEIIKEKQ